MTDAELLAELHALGIDQHSYRVVLLLPLVQVAWADGQVQAQERELILRVAGQHGLLDGAHGKVLRRWLDQAPDAESLRRGRRLLVALAHRHRGLGSELDANDLRKIQDLCVKVAQAAGGLFDSLFTVEDAEQRAMEEIAAAFGQQTAAVLEDLPSPEGGEWADLDDQLA